MFKKGYLVLWFSLLISSLCLWFFNYRSLESVNAEIQSSWPVIESDLFNNFYTWRKWKLKDFDPMYLLLKTRVKKEVDSYNNITVKYENSYLDINKDGNGDILITDFNKIPLSKKWDSKNYYEYQYFYWLLLGTSDFWFDIKYRCVYINNEIDSSKTWFYWDCSKF